MKTLIIYTSQTGFTKKYAGWIAERMGADTLELKEARKKDAGFFAGYDAIVYGGWAIAGNVAKSKWFLDHVGAWKDKRLAIFCVGGSPNDNPDVEVMLHKLLTDEQRKYIAAFYCQGGFNYEKMNLPAIRGCLMLIVMTSVAGYLLHVFTKLAMSSFHLARDYRERFQLTRVYLALMKSGDIKGDQQSKTIVMQSLFSRSDTGLLKGDNAMKLPSVSDLVGKGE